MQLSKPKHTNLAVSLIAIPAVNALLKRANYDNLQKVIDLADFLKDTTDTGCQERDPRLENRVLKYSEFLQEKTYAKSGLGKWMNQQSAGDGPGWDRYGTDVKNLASVVMLKRMNHTVHVYLGKRQIN